MANDKHVQEKMARLPRRFFADRSGNMSILFALTSPVIIGMGALGTEAGFLYMKKSAVQNVADLAAVSAAAAARDGVNAVIAEGKAVAAQLGYVDNVGGATVTINNPPRVGPKAGDSRSIEVIVETRIAPMLSKAVHPENYVIAGRAVATMADGGSGCVLALDSAMDSAVGVGGSTVVNMPNCNVFSNSRSASSISSGGNGVMSANIVGASGAIAGGGITANRFITGGAPLPNPYVDISAPAFSGCSRSVTKDDVQTLEPGVYCDGMTVNSGMTVNLNPGVYIFDGGAIKILGGALKGKGVTFVLTSSASTRFGFKAATIDIAGNSTVNITAPTTGDFSGVALWVDPRAAKYTRQRFNGGASQYIGGALVAATSSLEFSGNGVSGDGSGCTQIIAAQITFTGNSAVRTDCGSSGVKSLGVTTRAVLVE